MKGNQILAIGSLLLGGTLVLKGLTDFPDPIYLGLLILAIIIDFIAAAKIRKERP